MVLESIGEVVGLFEDLFDASRHGCKVPTGGRSTPPMGGDPAAIDEGRGLVATPRARHREVPATSMARYRKSTGLPAARGTVE